MTPEERAAAFVATLPPITDMQVEEIARILATVEPEAAIE